MALVTGIPDFYDSANPNYADFNLVHRLIVEQIGGQAPGAAEEYTEYGGNLNGSNISAAAGFRNAQKSEPRSVFTMEASDEVDPSGLICGPVPYDCEVFAAGIVNDDTSKITGGTATFYVNGVTIITITIPPANAANQMTGVSVRLQLRAGDVVHLSHALTFDGGASHKVRFTLFCLALHLA